MEQTQPTPEESKPAPKAASGDAKPAAAKTAVKAKAKAAKKEEKPKEPLVDNGDGTVTDPSTGLMWKKTDAWLDTHKFYTWAMHREYVDKVNKEKFAGYDNWRIPSKKEAATLVDKTKKCMDKNGTLYPIDPIFDAGSAASTWISECSDDKIIRFDLKIGIDTAYPTTDVWSSMRLVRKEGEAPPPPVGKEPEAPAAEAAATADAGAADAPAKTAAPQPAAAKAPSAGGTPKPIPKKNRTPEEKAAMLKRAKAHAAEVRARKAKGG